ncbi:hypothetical protein [Fodinibius halophilus]|uniref:Uncharacterized protein n=1 Tax=Fodinibius halophilus TaxID=1736908 RepID=A0A6M1TP33_9BACT|nr:hypothetical protein [Fodinibius halophilus]NGP90080.1 hypothetical protein [Fodinibius halophilus]
MENLIDLKRKAKIVKFSVTFITLIFLGMAIPEVQARLCDYLVGGTFQGGKSVIVILIVGLLTLVLAASMGV